MRQLRRARSEAMTFFSFVKAATLAAVLSALVASGEVNAQASPGVYVPDVGAAGGLLRKLNERQALYVESLQLNATQTLAAQQLQGFANRVRMESAARLSVALARYEQSLRQPNADLRQATLQLQAEMRALLQLHQSLSDARLAFYDTLDASQQSKVRNDIADLIERAQHLSELVMRFSSEL
jgi:hypothetical protein